MKKRLISCSVLILSVTGLFAQEQQPTVVWVTKPPAHVIGSDSFPLAWNASGFDGDFHAVCVICPEELGAQCPPSDRRKQTQVFESSDTGSFQTKFSFDSSDMDGNYYVTAFGLYSRQNRYHAEPVLISYQKQPSSSTTVVAVPTSSTSTTSTTASQSTETVIVEKPQSNVVVVPAPAPGWWGGWWGWGSAPAEEAYDNRQDAAQAHENNVQNRQDNVSQHEDNVSSRESNVSQHEENASSRQNAASSNHEGGGEGHGGRGSHGSGGHGGSGHGGGHHRR